LLQACMGEGRLHLGRGLGLQQWGSAMGKKLSVENSGRHGARSRGSRDQGERRGRCAQGVGEAPAGLRKKKGRRAPWIRARPRHGQQRKTLGELDCWPTTEKTTPCCSRSLGGGAGRALGCCCAREKEQGALREGEQRRHAMDAGELAARARTRGDVTPWLEQRWRWRRRPPVPAARQEEQGGCHAMAGLAPYAGCCCREQRGRRQGLWLVAAREKMEGGSAK
jgi:hypothetical protein